MCKLCNTDSVPAATKNTWRKTRRDFISVVNDYVGENPCLKCSGKFKKMIGGRGRKPDRLRDVDTHILDTLEYSYMRRDNPKECLLARQAIARRGRFRTKTLVSRGISKLTEHRANSVVEWYLVEIRRVDTGSLGGSFNTLKEAEQCRDSILLKATPRKHGIDREHKFIFKKEYKYGTRFLIAISKTKCHDSLYRSCETVEEAIKQRDEFLTKDKR